MTRTTYKSLGEKVKAWRQTTPLSPGQLAEKVGTSRQNIENLEQGSVGAPRYVIRLAKAVGCTVDDLLDLRKPIPSGNNAPQDSPIDPTRQTGYNSTHITSEVRTVPLFLTPPNDAGSGVTEPHPSYGTGTTSGKVGENGYALRVRGNSMLNPHGSPSFPEGCLIFVNPDMQAEPGHFIVTKLPDDGGFTFKKLTVDAGKRLLESLNPRFEIIPMPADAPVFGVVVALGMDLL